ncbi:MAG: PilN domain-containing protein [Ruminiclostridium sp.]|nr:PilN domain-containing protein [Ruminiclostridium sp.]
MKDFNFFSGYIKQKQLSHKKTKIIAAITSVLILAIAGSYAATELIVLSLRMDISEMNKYLNSGEVAAKKQQLELKKRQNDLVKGYMAMVDGVSARLDDISVIKSSLIEVLNKTLPASVYFKNMTFGARDINMTGAGGSRTAVAELYHNLVALGIFNDVYINSIQTDETGQEFTFNVKCILKDVTDQ